MRAYHQIESLKGDDEISQVGNLRRQLRSRPQRDNIKTDKRDSDQSSKDNLQDHIKDAKTNTKGPTKPGYQPP